MPRPSWAVLGWTLPYLYLYHFLAHVTNVSQYLGLRLLPILYLKSHLGYLSAYGVTSGSQRCTNALILRKSGQAIFSYSKSLPSIMTPHVKCNEVGQRAAWKQAAWKMGPGACEDRQSRWLNPSPGTPTQKEVRINQTLLLCLRSNLHKGNVIKTAFFLPTTFRKFHAKKKNWWPSWKGPS